MERRSCFTGPVINQPKSSSLQDLYWREEILQVMFWLKGEGLGDRVDWNVLERFLDVEADTVRGYLFKLVTEGYVEQKGDWFELTPKGLEDGKQFFADEFADLTRPAHGECGPDCWCHASADEADACLAERAARS